MTSHKPLESTPENCPSICFTTIFALRPVRLCKTLFFGYIYIIIFLSLYYLLFAQTHEYTINQYDYLELTSPTAIKIRRIRTYFNIIFLPVIILTSSIKFENVKKLYYNLNELDQKLKLFNVYLNYSKYMRKNIFYVIGNILFTVLIGMVEYYNLQKVEDSYRMYNFMWLSNLIPQMVNGVAISAFVVIVADISRRYQLINEIILNFKIPKKVATALSQDTNNVFQFKLLQQTYKILSDIVAEINDAYGFIVLLSMITYFFGICAHLIVVVQSYGNNSYMVDFIVDILWALFYLGLIVYVIDVCHNFQHEGKRASKVLHEYRVDSDNHLLKQESESFAQQVRNVDMKITACNFFSIDYPLLCKIILGLAAYVFFLTQFCKTE